MTELGKGFLGWLGAGVVEPKPDPAAQKIGELVQQSTGAPPTPPTAVDLGADRANALEATGMGLLESIGLVVRAPPPAPAPAKPADAPAPKPDATNDDAEYQERLKGIYLRREARKAAKAEHEAALAKQRETLDGLQAQLDALRATAITKGKKKKKKGKRS